MTERSGPQIERDLEIDLRRKVRMRCFCQADKNTVKIFIKVRCLLCGVAAICAGLNEHLRKEAHAADPPTTRVLWNKELTLEEAAPAATKDNLGNYISLRGEFVAGDSTWNTKIQKYSGFDGTSQWQATIGGFKPYPPLSIQSDAGNYVIAGINATPNVPQDIRPLIFKLSPFDGAVLWKSEFPVPPTAKHRAYLIKVAIDKDNNVFMLGALKGLKDICYVAKHAGGTGVRLWQTWDPTQGLPLNPPFNFADPTDFCVDATGNVLINTYTNVIKVSGETGFLLWQTPHPNGFTGAVIASDYWGNAFVSGGKSNSDGLDYCTLKYSGQDGSVLWEARDPATRRHFNKPSRILVDQSGDIVVYGPQEERTYRTGPSAVFLKYAGGNGQLLWRQSLPSTQTPAMSGALDSSGNLVMHVYLHDLSAWSGLRGRIWSAPAATFPRGPGSETGYQDTRDSMVVTEFGGIFVNYSNNRRSYLQKFIPIDSPDGKMVHLVHDANASFLVWDVGVLEESDSVSSEFHEIPSARSPYEIPRAGPQRFFRLRQ